MAQFTDNFQAPINGLGTKAQFAALGIHRVFFQGATGLVSTNYGVPGVTATRLSTGTYRLATPKGKGVYINPAIVGTSGTYYSINVQNVNGISGTAEFQISKGGLPQTPATGTVAELWFFVAPSSSF